mgnify:CR=1 FL=1
MNETIKQKAAELLHKFNQAVDAASEVSTQIEDKLKTVFNEVKDQVTDILDREEKEVFAVQEGEYVISPVQITINSFLIISAGEIFQFKSEYLSFIHTPLIIPTQKQLIHHGRLSQMKEAINVINALSISKDIMDTLDEMLNQLKNEST